MKVPQLRFKQDDGQDFPVWIASELQDIAKINPKSNALPDEFFYIDLESVERGVLLKETKVSKSEAPSRAQRLLQKNDVLFQMVRPYQGNNLYFDKIGDYVASTGYAQIKTSENAKFLFQYLQLETFTAEVINRCTGTSYPAINSSGLATIPVAIPSIEEQTKIANFLTAVDEKITQLTQKHELLTQYKKGVMQQIFTRELRFKDHDGGDFPEWEETTLGEVTELFSRRNKNLIDAEVYSVTNSNGFVLQTEHFEDRVIAGSDLSNYKIIYKDEFAYNPARVNVGSIALFTEKVGVISSLYVCFKCNHSLDNTFLLNFLELDSTKQNINSFGEGGVRIYLWYPLFAKLPISLPSIKEQKKIANFLTAIDGKITATQNQLQAVKQYKQGLLQQMFV